MPRRQFLAVLTASLVLAVVPAIRAQQPLSIAAASDLQTVLPQAVAQFEQQTGQRVRVSYGSSGNFFALIQNGAPFDLFLSADIDYPRRLGAAGLAEPGTLYQYAVGSLVMIAPKNRDIALAGDLQATLALNVRKVSIANPDHAPYGRAAIAALKNAGLYERVQPKLVLGENVSQAAQFVQTGNADVGIVARSLSFNPGLAASVNVVPLPAGSYPPIEQAAIVLKSSRQKALAGRFLSFMKTPDTQALFTRFGFDPPPR